MDWSTVVILAIDAFIIWGLFKLRKKAVKQIGPAFRDVRGATATRETMQQVADDLGLETYAQGPFLAAEGVKDGYSLIIEPMGGWLEDDDEARIDTRITVVAPDKLSLAIRMYPAPSVVASDQLQRVATHDPLMDEQYVLDGPEVDLRAILTHPNRQALLSHHGHVALEAGRLLVSGRALYDGRKRVEAMISLATDLARRLELHPSQTKSRLLENATSDPVADVRYANLATLVSVYRDEEEALAACKRATEDEDARIRFLAAIHLGEEGHSVIEALATGESPALTKRRALRHVASVFELDRYLPIIEAALSARSLDVREEAVQIAGNKRVSQLIPALKRLLRTAGPRTTRSIADAFNKIGDSAAEDALIPLLTHGSSDVNLAAIEALGRAGTADSVPHLMSISSDSELATLKSAAQENLTLIRERLAAEPGRLSIVQSGDKGGALSSPEGTEGSLSCVQSESE